MWGGGRRRAGRATLGAAHPCAPPSGKGRNVVDRDLGWERIKSWILS